MNFIDYSILIIYLVFTLGLGAWIGRRQGNTEDYFLAGRRMKWWPDGNQPFRFAFQCYQLYRHARRGL